MSVPFWKTTSKVGKVIHEKYVLFIDKIAEKYALNTTSKSLKCWKGSDYHETHIAILCMTLLSSLLLTLINVWVHIIYFLDEDGYYFIDWDCS